MVGRVAVTRWFFLRTTTTTRQLLGQRVVVAATTNYIESFKKSFISFMSCAYDNYSQTSLITTQTVLKSEIQRAIIHVIRTQYR